MSVLYDNFKKLVPVGSLGQNVKQGFSNTISSQYALLSGLENQLDTSTSNTEGFIAAFNQTDDIITDKVNDMETSVLNWRDDVTGVVSDEVGENIYNTLQALVDSQKTDDNPYGTFSISGEDGKFYQFVVLDEPTEMFGVNALICTCHKPNNIGDLLLYTDNDGYHLNPLVRCSDFNVDLYDMIGTSVDEILNQICYICNIEVPLTINGKIESICIKYNLTYTGIVATDLVTICTYLDIPYYQYNEDILTYVTLIYNKVVLQGYAPCANFCLLYDLLKQVVDGNELNNFILDIVHYIQSGADKALDLIDYISTRIVNAGTSVYNCAKQLIAACNRGGVFGAIKYLVSLVQSMSNLFKDESEGTGIMSLTDNSTYVPSSFLVGMVSTAVSNIGSLVSIVAGCFSRIAGLAFSAITAIASQIAKAVEYSFDSATLASIDGGAKSKANVFPFACAQFTLTYDDYYFSDKLREIAKGDLGIQMIPVIGGYLFLGTSSSPTNNIWPNIVCEFHPGIQDNSKLVEHLMEYWNLDTHISLGYTYVDFNTVDSNSWEMIEALYGLDAYSDSIGYVNSLKDEHGNVVLSHDDDVKMRTMLIENTFLFLLIYDPEIRQHLVSGRSILIDPVVQPDYDLSSVNLFASMAWACYDNTPYSWNDIANMFSNAPNLYVSDMVGVQHGGLVLIGAYIFNNKWYCGDIVYTYDSEFEFPIKIPKYDRKTIWYALAFGVLIASAAVFASIKFGVKASRWIKQKKLTNAANAESLWEAYKSNPSTDNYKAYRKAVKKNNRFVSIFGGTKYSTEGFWASVDEGDTSSSFLAMRDGIAENGDQSDINLNYIYNTITGSEI